MYKISKLLGQGSFGQVFVIFKFDDRNKFYATKKFLFINQMYHIKIV